MVAAAGHAPAGWARAISRENRIFDAPEEAVQNLFLNEDESPLFTKSQESLRKRIES
jgi:hypothetical protein